MKMKSSKVLAALLSFSLISFSPVSALAADLKSGETIMVTEQRDQLFPVEIQPYYRAFAGKVMKIADYGSEGAKMISLESAEGLPANIIVTPDTYVLDNAPITQGSLVTVFYDASLPMIMIYPPQYVAEVIVVGEIHQNLKVDVFDQDLVSADNTLKLNLAETTEILTPDGKDFIGELANKKLLVIYGATTKSIPAQTIPTKIIVLPDKGDTPSRNSPAGADGTANNLTSSLAIIINGEKLEKAKAYVDDKGRVMVPLRPVANALGLEVRWEGEGQRIFLGKDISLQIGVDCYSRMDGKPLPLETAPVLQKGVTYVPLSFWREVIPGMEMNFSGTEIVMER